MSAERLTGYLATSFSNAALFAGVSSIDLLPVQGPDLPGVHEPPAQDRDEHDHLHEPEDAEALEDEGPGVEEGRVHVEEDEDHAYEVELDREALARVADRRHAALVDRVLGGVRPRPTQELGHDEREDGEAERHDAQDEEGSVGGKHHPVSAEVLEPCL